VSVRKLITSQKALLHRHFRHAGGGGEAHRAQGFALLSFAAKTLSRNLGGEFALLKIFRRNAARGAGIDLTRANRCQ
jgi:hypothetical protein